MGRRKISDLFDSEMETKQRNREHYGSRIKKYRVRKGLSAEALALSLRVSLSTVRNWEAGISRPDLALLSPIFALLDVDPNEFFGLEGVGHSFSEEEDRIISFFRAMDPPAKEDYAAVGEALAARSHDRKLREVRSDVVALKWPSSSVAAGEGDGWLDEENRMLLVYAKYMTRDADLAFTVSGDSMAPKYRDGDLVLVKTCKDMKIGEDYIWSVRGRGLLLKQAGPDRLISLNPDYPDILLSEEEGAAVVGRVVSRVEKEMIVPPDVESLYWEAMEVR